MLDPEPPIALRAVDCPPRRRASAYPDAVMAQVEAALAGREKRALGAVFGLGNFGVNLTRLAPGAISALRHAHARQDEFIYVLGAPERAADSGVFGMRTFALDGCLFWGNDRIDHLGQRPRGIPPMLSW